MIYCVADVHLENRKQFSGELIGGVNARARDIASILRRAFELPQPEDSFVILGDLFDSAKPSPALIRSAQLALDDDTGTSPEVHVIVGNHDMSSDVAGDNACSPLAPIANVVESTPHLLKDEGNVVALLVPFKTPVAEAIAEAISYVSEDADWVNADERLLLGHWGISDKSDPPYMLAARDAIAAEELADICFMHRINGVCAGNWHGRRGFEFFDTAGEFAVHMLQIGALVPTGFDNPGWDGYGTVAWWNSQDAHWCHRELPGPRFLRHVPSREELKAHRDCKVHVRVDVSTEQAEEVQQQLASLPVFSGHTRIVADSQEKIQRLSAASAARSASTVGKALAEYIKKMPIPVGVDRDEVFAITKEYLDQG